jgi:hypothetical protein
MGKLTPEMMLGNVLHAVLLHSFVKLEDREKAIQTFNEHLQTVATSKPKKIDTLHVAETQTFKQSEKQDN